MSCKNKESRSCKRPSNKNPGSEPGSPHNFILLPASIQRNWHQFTPQQRGGLVVKHLYGREHLQQLGKRGFQATVDKWFGGNRRVATQWLAAKGLYTQDKDVSYGSVFPDPGPHPAHR